ncbi:hypothetical protein PENSUB_13463 [Penicillium subrubescens]|uniref:Uncharacterized protein n=1 Tax=Penicillium subrubescens TaxID=1316194 RepID=A0A1Q5SQT0_9EURO|nr:hypothetical protein PENSUB_13463 [Penicillium subrubescens]
MPGVPSNKACERCKKRHLKVDEHPPSVVQNEGQLSVSQDRPGEAPSDSGNVGTTFSFQLEPSRTDFGTDIPMAEVTSSAIQPGIAAGATPSGTQIIPGSQYGPDINRIAGSSTRSPLQNAEVLDLSDAGKFFSVYVPIRALNCQSLKYAIAASAAKQLGRVKGSKSCTGRGTFTSPATTETYPNAEQVDWFLKAANYYYLSVSDLTTSTSDGYSVVSTSAVLDSPIDLVGRWLNTQSVQNLDDGALLRKTEETLATVTILTLYKLLDAKGEEWHMYLTGIRQVFNSLLQMKQKNSTFFSHGIRACFWNFSRQDYLGSYYIRSPTHFDPTNLPLWRAAGISIDELEKFHIIASGSIDLSQEDQTSNGLCWLVSKVVNFLAKSKQSQIAQWTGSPPETSSGPQDTPTSSSQQTSYPDTNVWLDLCFEFQTWFEGVPETIRPCVRIEHPRDVSKPPDGSQIPFPEVFHSLPTCAAAMQHYHFGRIALLLNRPQDVISGPSTAFDRLQGYREVTKEVEYRSREVCGIALGRPHSEVRIYMIPLLFAVGQCLESANERQIIVDLLRGVEADLGWATEYAVEKLHSSWNR